MPFDPIPTLPIRKRLMEWGHWTYKIETMGLSYAKKSIVAQLMDEKITSDGNAFQERVEEMEALLERMASPMNSNAFKLEWVKVIRVHYTRFSKTREEKIRLAHLPKTTYYRYLSDAHEWISRELFP